MESIKTKTPDGPGILDRAFLSLLRWDWEKIAWVALLLVAVLSRTIGLGDRAMTHDESLHTVYSWQLYDGRGYQHQPMMHGPLKFVLNAVMYFLFGVNDWSSRIQVAMFGVLMIGLVWLLRGWLGRTGAFLAATMYTLSPALLYHSRYIRDEVMLCALLVLMVIAMFRYLETRRALWLNWTAVALALAFLTMEASFIFGGLFGAFLILALTAQLSASPWPDAGRKRLFLFASLIGLVLLAAGLLLVIFKLKLVGLVLLGLGGLGMLVAVVLVILSWGKRAKGFAELDLIVLLATLVLPFAAALVMKVLGWEITQFNNPGQITLSLAWKGLLVAGLLFAVGTGIGWFWLRNRYFVAAGFFWAIVVLFYTTFLTNGQGLGTGIIGSLGYWIDQQEVMRGGQPWYYFLLQVPLYEFLPWLLSIGGTIAWVAARGRRKTAQPEQKEGVTQELASEPLPARPQLSARTVFEAFLVYWPLATWAVFTYVGEKMPWHVTYFATAMTPLGALWLGRLIDGVDWRAGWQRGIAWVIGMTPLLLIGLKALIPTSTRKPFSGVSVNELSNSAQWLVALALVLVLLYYLYDRFVALGWRQGLRGMVLALAGLLFVFTLAVSYRFSFINYDYATEPMVYAHATPDIRLAISQIEELSRKTAGDHAIRVAYDDDSTWPLEWYFRDYPNKVYFGASPSRDSMDSPIVIVGDKNIGKVRPYLGDRYYEFNYRLVWWPKETYKNLSWQRIWDGVRDPLQRGQFWDVVIHRRYTTPTAQWDPIHRFSMFVRKDVAAQVWDWGAPTAALGLAEAAPSPFEGKQIDWFATQQIGLTGVSGNEPGRFNFPRAVAVDAEGKVYVADSGNNRVQVFGPDGSFLREWGGVCKLDTGEGCDGDGAGQFNEPWGIAVGADGSVYVSDTWNHRVQKFDALGNFQTQWGRFDSTGGELGAPNVFYGPRSLTIGLDGNVYVMDTGNKRIQAFSPDGQFLAQYGGGGVVEGRFDEPVGLGQDALGNWYVGDTWNLRIQKLDPAFQFVQAWPLTSWDSQSVVNKPALAVDAARGIVYATDPENYRVIAFNTDGSVRALFGLYGNDAQSFALPTGIAVGPDGRIYVADGDNHRVMIFPQLP